MTMTTVAAVDRAALETKVKDMYSDVAANPHGEFHFEMGRAMAERLGYAPEDLDRIPSAAIDSFAGVGHFFRSEEHTSELQSQSNLVCRLLLEKKKKKKKIKLVDKKSI